MKRLAILAAALILFAQPTLAAPRASSASECAVIGNMAFVAGTLSKHGIPAAKALKLMPDLYAGLYAGRTDAGEISALVISAAYRHRRANPKDRPVIFSELLTTTCQQGQGDMDSLLGKRT